MRVVPRVYFKLSVPEYILYSGILYFIKTASGGLMRNLKTALARTMPRAFTNASPKRSEMTLPQRYREG